MEWDWQDGKLVLWLTDEEAKHLRAALHEWRDSISQEFRKNEIPPEMAGIVAVLNEALD